MLGGWSALIAGAGVLCYFTLAGAVVVPGEGSSPAAPVPWHTILTPAVLLMTLSLGGMSAFFSASEVAFLSLNKVELRSFASSDFWIRRLIARMLKRPGSLLTTILMGNTIVNVLLSITFAEPVADFFRSSVQLPAPQAYALAVVITTSALLFFCEILPKVFAVTRPETYTIAAAIPLFLVDKMMMPLRYGATSLVGFLFKVTKLSQVKPAPFLTDDEFITLLSEGEASGIIEEEERQMIEGILEFGDVTLREVLVPRPDIVAVKETASVKEALDTVCEHEYARMPVYQEDLDHIIGILYAKDLLPVIEEGDWERPVTSCMRPPHFVPETMSVGDFVKSAQRMRIHIAIVVDEYGGTEGLVTLQDALREVVGDIGEEDDLDEPMFNTVEEGVWQVAGSFPLDEFEQAIGISSGDDEHTTVGGFLMTLSDKILEPGDELEFSGLHFVIEEVDKKRVIRVLVKDSRHIESESTS